MSPVELILKLQSADMLFYNSNTFMRLNAFNL